MSQWLVDESAGARTPLSGLLASLVVLVVVLFFSRLLRYLPQPVLAAIVLAAVGGMFNAVARRRADRTAKESLSPLAAVPAGLGRN